MPTASPKKPISARKWQALFNLTVLGASFYAFMEWVFFATKPSSVSVLSPIESAKVLFATAGTVALVFLFLLLLFSLPALFIKRLEWQPRLFTIAGIAPALLLSILLLILLDNFTYTVFDWGIVSTKGIWRGLYAVGFLLVVWRMLVFVQKAKWARKKFAFYLTLSLLALSIAAILTVKFSRASTVNALDTGSANTTARYPNIIILGSDGLSANYLSAYGAENKTTPFLSELMETSLVAENAFTNSSSTTGSTTSMLTGKKPFTDKVYRYPDVLSGRDSYEHLPGILRQRGYQTVEIGTPSYVDARKLNLLEGFDIVNGQPLNTPASQALKAFLGNSASTYFIQTIAERASERLLHIFLIREMENPLKAVNNPSDRLSDEQRLDQIIDLLDHADRPVFVFAHLMDTHGPHFSAQKQVFSSESATETEWDPDRYQDAILTFDGHLKRLYDHLAETGELDNTILVIYTDHGFKYAIRERIPIVIHFPENAYAGRLKNNVQITDVPPTLLDYLDIPTPIWMKGRSLLKGEAPAAREIVAITTGSPKEITPPFNQIKIVQIVVCQKWYRLNVRTNRFESGLVGGHTAKCDDSLLPSNEEARQKIVDYLRQYGYDISSLQ